MTYEKLVNVGTYHKPKTDVILVMGGMQMWKTITRVLHDFDHHVVMISAVSGINRDVVADQLVEMQKAFCSMGEAANAQMKMYSEFNKFAIHKDLEIEDEDVKKDINRGPVVNDRKGRKMRW